MVLDKLIKSKEDFKYSDKIEEIKPLTLNLCLINTNGVIQAELRKRFVITDSNKGFWINFFEKSLLDNPIKVEAQIVFRDKLASKQKFKEFGLLNSGESTPIKVEKKPGLLEQISKELSNTDIQAMAKWSEEEFFK